MVYHVAYADALNDDLNVLRGEAVGTYLVWQQVIDELWDNASLRATLTVNRGFRPAQPQFDTVFIRVLLDLGYNIGRVKIYRSPQESAAYPQRLLYAVDHRITPSSDGTVWLLGLMPRKADYDPKDPLVRRVCEDYDQIGIPRLGDCR